MNNNTSKILKFKEYLKENKEIILFTLLVFLFYFIFFKNIFNNQFNFWNSDAMIKMFPVRVFLYEKLSNFEFPLWTERVFLGYPIYVDIENGALNPLNLLTIFLFGPVWSLKILHFLTYFFGSLCIYYTFKKLYPNSNLVGSLIAVLLFYFNFFQINHLIHMNIVLVSMLLPIHIYLVIKYSESEKLNYLIFQILLFSYGILWGQPQISFFNFIVITFFYILNSKSLKKTFNYLLVVGFFSFCSTLYQLLPTYNFFIESQRIGKIVKYSDFTNSTTLLFNNIFPYSLGYYQNFLGTDVSGSFSFVETYNYISVISIVFFIYYLVFGYQDKFFKFVACSIYFYLIFTFLGNFFSSNIPFYSNFRYWTRGVFIISFILGFCINHLLSIKEINNVKIKPKFIHLISILGFLIFTFVFETKDYINFLISNNFIYLKKIDLLIWFLILFFSLISTYLFLKGKVSLRIFSGIILFLVLFDLRYYASDFLSMRISRYKSEQSYKTDADCISKRCLLENQNYSGYEFLLFKNYSPFGYSQFIQKEYIDFFEKNFKANIEQSPRSEEIRREIDPNFLKNLGFQKILLANGKSIVFPENNFWIMKENELGSFIKPTEGDYKFKVNAPETRVYDLNLKYSKNFKLYINNQRSELIKNGNFSGIYLEKGENIINIYYYPYDIQLGFITGFLLILISIIFYASFQKIKI